MRQAQLTKLATKTSPFSRIAQEVEALSQKKAFELVDKLLAEEGENDFTLGGVLSVISSRAKGEEEWLDGYPTFRDLCDKRFKMHYRKALYLISIYLYLVKHQIPWNDVKDLGWTKLSYLAQYKALSNGNVQQVISKVKKMSTLQMRAYLAGQPSDIKTITFRVTYDQFVLAHKALNIAQKLTKSRDHTGALMAIMKGYLDLTKMYKSRGSANT